MTTVLVDTSVLIKWFHHEGESEVSEARALRDATTRGDVESRIIDLALYEMGNVLSRSLGWPGTAVADQLADIVTVCGAPLALGLDWHRWAAIVGHRHGLTFYDAAWAAAAEALDVALVSADDRLLGAGLAESPADAARRLRLPLA
jgi:predicted nucleic acid-binding protein